MSLTALSSTLVFVTMPFLLQLGLDTFQPVGDATVSVPVLETMVQVAGITVVPVLIGMFVRSRNAAFADRMERPGKIFATVFLFVIIPALYAVWMLLTGFGFAYWFSRTEHAVTTGSTTG